MYKISNNYLNKSQNNKMLIHHHKNMNTQIYHILNYDKNNHLLNNNFQGKTKQRVNQIIQRPELGEKSQKQKQKQKLGQKRQKQNQKLGQKIQKPNLTQGQKIQELKVIEKKIPNIVLKSNANLSSKIKLRSLVSDENCKNVYAISNCGIHLSINYGLNWDISSAPTNLCWTAISCDYSGQYIISAAIQSSSLFEILFYYSNDYGRTLNISYLKNENKNEYCVSITFKYKSFIALTSSGNIYESINYGYTWLHKLTIHNKCNLLVSDYIGENLFTASSINEGGVYISNDFGTTWHKESKINNCNSITVSKSGQYVAAICNVKDVGEIYTSEDYGKTWNKRFVLNTVWMNITSDNSGKYLAATSFSSGGDIYVSNDFGMTWNKSNTSINNLRFIRYNSKGSFLIATTLNVLDENLNINTYEVLN